MISSFDIPMENPEDAASELAAEREAHAGTRARLKLLERTLLHFVPRDLISFLGKASLFDVELGDQVEKSMTVVFTDIRNFTRLSESMTPQQTFNMINSYLSSMNPVISAHHGIIDKYMGDAIMALFPHSADDAVKSGLSMLARLDEYNAGRSRAAYPPIRIGIGINTGRLMLGVIGGRNRMEGTVISHAVNLASRLQTLTKTFGTPLLISEHTLYSLAEPHRYSVRHLGRVNVPGTAQSESIYEVFDHDEQELKEKKILSLSKFEEALAYYHIREVARARPMLEEIIKDNPDDIPARVYLQRCEDSLKTGIHIGEEESTEQPVWKPEYELGITQIDTQHQKLLMTIGQLHLAVTTGQNEECCASLIHTLENQVADHFEFEERMMQEHHYPFASDHIAQHNSYQHYFYKLKREIEAHSSDPLYLGFRIKLFLADWLINHAKRDDLHLGRFLTERGAFNAPL
jgi:hemerythrin